MKLLWFPLLAMLSACNSTPSVEEGFLGFSSQTGSDSNSTTTDAPTIIGVSIDSSSGTSPSPVITIIGTNPGDTVTVFSDSSCTNELTSATASDSSIALTLTLTSEGSYSFYGKITRSGVSSLCSTQSASYTYFTIDQIDDDNSATGFAGGTHSGTSSTSGSLTLTSTTNTSTHSASWTPSYANIIAYYQFDNNLTEQINGTAGSSLGAGAGYSTSAKIGTHAFDSTASTVRSDLGTSTAIDNLSQVASMSLWINTTETVCAAAAAYVGFRTGANNFEVGVGLNCTTVGVVIEDGSRWYISPTPTTMNNGEWRHIVAVRNGQNMTIYVDGVQVFSDNSTIYSATSLTTNTIGGGFHGATNALIDEVALWDGYELTATDVRLIYEHQRKLFSGEFISRVMDAASSSPWTNMTIKSELPYGKTLSGDGDGDTIPDSETTASYSGLSGSLSSGLILSYDFENNATDGSGQGNNGTITGTKVAAGIIGQARYFTADDSDIINATAIDSTNDVSVSMWIRPESYSANPSFNPRLFMNLTNGSLQLILSEGGNLVWGGPSGGIGVSRPPLGKWTHVLVTKTGTTRKVFYNGVEQASGAQLPGNPSPSSNILRLGSAITSGAPNGNYEGAMDEVYLWNRVLTNAEVLEVYKRGLMNAKYQIRSCDDDACSGESWIGPDGTSSSYFSEFHNRESAGVYAATGAVQAAPLSFTFVDFTAAPASNRYFQYKAFLESDDSANLCSTSTCYPTIQSITIGPSR